MFLRYGPLTGLTIPAQCMAISFEVSHWTAEEIVLEESLKAQAKNIKPDYIARHSFADVLDALDIKSTARVTQVAAIGSRTAAGN